MEYRPTPWTPSGINGSGRRSHQVQLTFIQTLAPTSAPVPENLLRITSYSCLTAAPCDERARSTALRAIQDLKTAGDRATRTHYKCHLTMTETMMLRKYKPLDCSNVFVRFTRTVSALFSYFMMTLIMR